MDKFDVYFGDIRKNNSQIAMMKIRKKMLLQKKMGKI